MTHLDESTWRADPWDDPDATGGLVVERTRRSFRPVRWIVWIAIYVGLAAIVSSGLSWFQDRKSTRLNSSHVALSRMPSSA